MGHRSGATSARGGTIRGRVVRTLVPPLVAMLVLLSVVAAGEVAGYRAANATETRVDVVLALQSLARELQTERGVTAGMLAGDERFRAEIAAARERVDARRDRVEALLAGGGPLAEQAAEQVEQLDELRDVRAGADAGSAGDTETFDFYTELIEELGDIFLDLETVADDQLRRGAESLEMLNQATEAIARERAVLNVVFSAGGFEAGEFADFVKILAVRDLALGEFDEFAGPDAARAKDALFASPAAAEARAMEQVALEASGGERLRVGAERWWTVLATVLDDLSRLAQRIGADAQDRAQQLRERATVRVGALSAVVLLCLAGSLYLATVATRSLAEPLAALSEEAHRLAGERLPAAVSRAVAGGDTTPPDPVRVPPDASGEVRRVADALDRVQTTAYTLATEQAALRRTSAESLANLGRRNQNLLRRQLGFITHLEREESDPAELANLFELDHLATRMRRNAESLLVLVGAASPRQRTRPVALADVIRSAVSEVEEYRRVVLRRMDDATVHGPAASGLAHMLAELVENGLTFSPPDLEVEIHGRRLDDGYLIAICDQGVGMTDPDLRRANERLRGGGDFLTAPARFLGHYVVGRLAAEMNVDVQLTPSPVIGVTARVVLPAGLLADPPALAPVEPDPLVAQPVRVSPLRVRPQADEVDYVVLPERPVTWANPEPLSTPASVSTPASPGTSGTAHASATVAPIVPAPIVPAPIVPAPRATMDTRALHRDGDSGAEPPRTPNGLRKRIPRVRPPVTPGPAPAAAAEAPALVTDSPRAVRDRLTALRDGIHRGARRP
ncbi:nitrate- and nitrite sensing domain-containing protein [Actinoplanes sp. NPDC023936]|uniref:sensor histidine kinase n=1 Tax=Actinoplanes sp. NPDC023936 TaxID=3154910 RepID=UPI0033D886E9